MPLVITRVNDYTFETESFVEVTTWRDGEPMSATNLGALYWQDTDPLSPNVDKYFRLAYDSPIPLSRWNITQAIFEQLLLDLGNGGGTIYFDRELSITSSLDMTNPLKCPADVALQFAAGKLANVQAGFNISTNATLTIPPNIIAGDYQIFYGPGKVRSKGTSTYTANLFWFGVLGSAYTSDDTAAFQKYVDYCVLSGGDLVYIRDGRYEFKDRIDFTGCKRIIGETINTTLAGWEGKDLCYWKGTGEPGYVALTDIEIRSLRLVINTNIPAVPQPLPLRVGFGGELVKQCAIHMPGAFNYRFDQLFVTTNNGPATGACGFFSDGQAYKVNFGSFCEFRGMDYGVIVGVSEKSVTIQPKPVTSYNPATGVFTMPNTYAANYQMALIWDNSIGDITGIMPRDRYYIVNPTATTFQISTAASGSPILFTTTATVPQVYVIQAGSSSIEFACDEWASLHLITRTNKVGFSVPNMEQCHFGTFGCQSTKVAARILSYRSLTRSQANNISFREIYTEGPQDSVNMVGKEYMRFEGEYIVVQTPLRVYNGAYVNIYASKCNFYGFIFNNATPRINVYGNNNTITNIGSYNKDAQVTNVGSGNKISYSKNPGGFDTSKYQNILSRNTFSREMGGFFPDYLLNGNPNSPYLSENVLFHPALSALFNGNSAGSITYLYDSPPQGLNGYARLATASSGVYKMAINNPLGSSFNLFMIGQFFPKSKWRLYAVVRSMTVTQDVTIAANEAVKDTGPSYSRVVSVTNEWTVISLDCDHSGVSSTTFAIQISVQTTTAGLDLAYFVVVPYREVDLSASILNTSALLDFPPTAPSASSDLTISVPGAVPGDVVSLGIPAASVTPVGSFFAWVNVADTITVRFLNLDAAAQDPLSGIFKVKVFK